MSEIDSKSQQDYSRVTCGTELKHASILQRLPCREEYPQISSKYAASEQDGDKGDPAGESSK